MKFPKLKISRDPRNAIGKAILQELQKRRISYGYACHVKPKRV